MGGGVGALHRESSQVRRPPPHAHPYFKGYGAPRTSIFQRFIKIDIEEYKEPIVTIHQDPKIGAPTPPPCGAPNQLK